jgi:hypothetical protein
VVNARDVGASYGFAAVAAVLAYRFTGRRRALYAAGLVGFAGVSLALSHNFTYWGHLIALAIGFGCYPIVRKFVPTRSARYVPEPRTADA